MDPFTIAAPSIVSALAVTSSMTSVCSCHRTEQFVKKMTTETTAVDMSNKVTHKTAEDGSVTCKCPGTAVGYKTEVVPLARLKLSNESFI